MIIKILPNFLILFVFRRYKCIFSIVNPKKIESTGKTGIKYLSNLFAGETNTIIAVDKNHKRRTFFSYVKSFLINNIEPIKIKIEVTLP